MINDERLIDLVRDTEVLYNKACPGYRMPDRKLAAWASIARELGSTEDQCSKRWTSLRERFSKEMRALDSPSGSSATSHRPWHLMANMEFIKPYVAPRPTRCSSNILTEFSRSQDNSSPLTSSPILFASSDTEQAVSSTPKTTKRRHQEAADDDFREVCQLFKEVQRERLSENRRLRSFGDMIVATIGEMSQRKQAKAIKIITTAVMELELESEE